MENIISNIALALPGFLLAVVCHEAAHAWMALKFGDDTGQRLGRLSLNPVVHADPFGTILLPLVLLLMGGTPFGYAKPVPVQPGRFKNIKKGIWWVSFAGPLANISLALLSGMLYAVMLIYLPGTFTLRGPFLDMLNYSLMINVVLAIFNLLPLPVLDGGQMISTFMSYETSRKFSALAPYTFIILLVLFWSGLFSKIASPFYSLAIVVRNLFVMLFSGALF